MCAGDGNVGLRGASEGLALMVTISIGCWSMLVITSHYVAWCALLEEVKCDKC